MDAGMITIDGSHGEGGGQILRSALALSSICMRPFRMVNIRRNRKKPGLMPQHLTAVNAAQAISGGDVDGNRLRSTEITFRPGVVRGGNLQFSTGTAGSTSLVLQTILPIILFRAPPSTITVTGGTHNPMSPPYHYLREVFQPLLRKIGCTIDIDLRRCGFYPAGGGEITAKTTPVRNILPLRMEERGKLLKVAGVSAVARLPESIAERQRQRAGGQLSALDIPVTITTESFDAACPGTFIFLTAVSETAVAGFSALGARGKPAETVGEEATGQLLQYAVTGKALDPHAADQIVLYLAFCREESHFTTSMITLHLMSNLWLIEQFIPISYHVDGALGAPGRITMQGKG